MKFGFKHIILAAALMSAGSLTAQEQNDKTSFQKYNWFVTGAVNGEWLSNTPATRHSASTRLPERTV